MDDRRAGGGRRRARRRWRSTGRWPEASVAAPSRPSRRRCVVKPSAALDRRRRRRAVAARPVDRPLGQPAGGRIALRRLSTADVETPCASSPGARGCSSRHSSARRITGCRPTTSRTIRTRRRASHLTDEHRHVLARDRRRARDFGWIGTVEMVERLEETLATIGKLERSVDTSTTGTKPRPAAARTGIRVVRRQWQPGRPPAARCPTPAGR